MKWFKKRRIEKRKEVMDELLNMDEDDLKKIVKNIKNTKTKQKRHVVIRTIAEVLLFGTMGIFGTYSLSVDSIAYPRQDLKLVFDITLSAISFIFFLLRICFSLDNGLFTLSYSKIRRQSRAARFIEDFFGIKNDSYLNYSFLKLSGILYDLKKIAPKVIEDKISKCSNSINGMDIKDEELTAKTLKIFMPLIALHGTVDNVDEASANELVEKTHISEQLDELNNAIIRKVDEMELQSARRANEIHSMNQSVVTEISDSLEHHSKEQKNREETLAKFSETNRLNDIINKVNESRNVMIEKVSNQ